ncbi:MAG: hypothetical protein AB8F94_20590 [Saprospiraceae bacterium]
MKLLYSIIFLISTNLLFAQDTLNNKFPNYFITTIELRYELIELKKKETFPNHFRFLPSFDLDQTIKPFSPDELPPYFYLELSEEDIFNFQSGFEIEPMEYFWRTENNGIELTSDHHYTNSSWVISTNYDTKESANFYDFWVSKNASYLKNQVTILSLFYQKEKFLRSVFEWDLKFATQNIHLNFSYLNNNFYQHESNTAIGNGNRRHVFFPKKYHEQKMSDWVHSNITQNQNISGTTIFANLLFSPYKKTFLKFESDLHWFFLAKDKRMRQRFRTFGIGAKPMEGTIIFLEYTNRIIGFNQTPNFLFFEEKPYFSLSAKQIFKLRLFKRSKIMVP